MRFVGLTVGRSEYSATDVRNSMTVGELKRRLSELGADDDEPIILCDEGDYAQYTQVRCAEALWADDDEPDDEEDLEG